MFRKLISIVSPCFNEEGNVEACAEAVAALFSEGGPLEGYDYEHIFVDNCSTDGTAPELRRMAARDKRIRVVINARNYGPFRSTFNALRHAKGDAILPMLPVDLQDPVELIPQFVEKWEEGYMRVFGVRASRAEGAVMRTVRASYYWAVNKFSNIKITPGVAEFQLIDRQVLDALLTYRDYYPYIRGMIENVGFQNESCGIEYRWQERRSGLSKNRLLNLIDQGLNGLISFTNFPMRLVIFVGLVVSFLSLIYGAIQLVLNLFFETNADPGVATIIVSVFFFSGVQLFIMGIFGEYISAIHFQVRQGDFVVERETINL